MGIAKMRVLNVGFDTLPEPRLGGLGNNRPTLYEPATECVRIAVLSIFSSFSELSFLSLNPASA